MTEGHGNAQLTGGFAALAVALGEVVKALEGARGTDARELADIALTLAAVCQVQAKADDDLARNDPGVDAIAAARAVFDADPTGENLDTLLKLEQRHVNAILAHTVVTTQLPIPRIPRLSAAR
ncbi:hypothetical protein [Mycobacterium servetii]|uniref:Fis family transcriptional regulator n=1 Tax=Mycobacterium servetii TaxID=3237418 RepID=A0ABV4BV83_9MYCO